MVNLQTLASLPPQNAEESVSKPARDKFDQMYGRLKGTMKIVGNIVDPDPELWNCERD